MLKRKLNIVKAVRGAVMDLPHKAEYEAQMREFMVTLSQFGTAIAIGLVLTGMSLDLVLYPNDFALFLSLRVLASIMIAMMYLVSKSNWGAENIAMVGMIWLLIPQIMIAAMISMTGGWKSSYWAGMTLSIFAASIILPYGIMKSMAFGITSFFVYVTACAINDPGFYSHQEFYIQSIFILMVTCVGIFGAIFKEWVGIRLFRLKEALAEKVTELQSVNKNLLEIKGQLLQQDKMAALGTLSAGLLHEVNNPVNFCLMAVEVGLEDPLVGQSSSLKECLLDAQTGMRRVQQIVSDLKTFAYRGPTEGMSMPFYFDKALDSALRLSGHELRPVRVSTDLDANSLVRGDEALIIGVLINLLTNAALALQSKGHGDPLIEVTSRWINGRLFVAVCDNGRGIAPHNLERIFEPFFTTRDVGKGLGLGLSISYSVIENHGGRLVAESQEGAWTRMSFDLPSGADHA